MAATLYGIPNCDTVKKARVWLSEQGVDEALLEAWVDEHGWETVLNRSGTTFRALPEAEKTGIDAERAVRLMLAKPSMIKRPILDLGDRRIVGFKPETYAAALT
jgi:arsenate reductase